MIRCPLCRRDPVAGSHGTGFCVPRVTLTGADWVAAFSEEQALRWPLFENGCAVIRYPKPEGAM